MYVTHVHSWHIAFDYRISDKRKGGTSFKRIAQGTITKQLLDSKHGKPQEVPLKYTISLYSL